MGRNRRIAGLLALAVFLGTASLCAQASELEEIPEEAWTEWAGGQTGEAEETLTEETEDDTARKLSVLYDVIALSADELNIELPENSEQEMEKYLEYVSMAAALMRNEDFRSLMSYKQVQELIEVSARRTMEFFNEDRETANKVLVALGLNERAVRILNVLARDGSALERFGYYCNRDLRKDEITQDDLIVLAADILADEQLRDVAVDMFVTALQPDQGEWEIEQVTETDPDAGGIFGL